MPLGASACILLRQESAALCIFITILDLVSFRFLNTIMSMQIECDKRKNAYSHLVTLKCENKDTFIDFKYTVF